VVQQPRAVRQNGAMEGGESPRVIRSRRWLRARENTRAAASACVQQRVPRLRLLLEFWFNSCSASAACHDAHSRFDGSPPNVQDCSQCNGVSRARQAGSLPPPESPVRESIAQMFRAGVIHVGRGVCRLKNNRPTTTKVTCRSKTG